MTRAPILQALSEERILETVQCIAVEQFDWQRPLEHETRLIEDLRLDSLKMLALAVEVENRFRICLSESDERSIETVGDLVTVVSSRLAEGTGGDTR